MPGPPSGPLQLARSQSWEDPALLAALAAGPGDSALVCEPSGDDALALTALGPVVTAVVPDAAARALVELKRAAARELPIQSVRSLLGLGHFGRRVWFYHYLRPGLPPDVAALLDAHEAGIRAGLVQQGAVEREMAAFRERVLPLVVRRDAVPALLEARTPAAREAALLRWSGLRWRAAAELWGPRLARLAGAPIEGASQRLALAMRRGGFFLEWLLEGAWRDPDGAHPWLSASGLAALKPRTGALTVVTGTRSQALDDPPRDGWSIVVLGRAPLTDSEASRLAAALRPGARVLGWGPPPAAPLAIDAPVTAHLRELDRGLYPGEAWIAKT